MGKFITLTLKHSGQPILVNVDKIETVHRDYSQKTDTVYVERESESIAVQESLESVENLIRRAEKTDNLISKNLALEAIESIRGCIWSVDIPSPTVPEYVEHHEQMQMLMRKCDAWLSIIEMEPAAQPETCEGCKHLGKWENEIEYGFLSPCTCCKRRVEDNYER